jgi:hypothetical protein
MERVVVAASVSVFESALVSAGAVTVTVVTEPMGVSVA